MEKMTINQLPSRTWNRLGVNEASIDWDESATVVLPEESAEKADMLIASDAAYACKRVTVQAEKGAKKSLFQTLRTAGKLHVQTELTAEDGAEIELIQLVVPGENALVYDEVIGHCHGSGRIVLRQVTLGHGDVYAQTGIGLDGENASFAANIGYLARKNQTLDMNLVVNHWGKKTKCEINASGALNDAAKKIFRGTIDFKRGSSGSVGSEQETVLMLGEDAVNKTVPVILCAEENVEGTHGATIGEMDDDTRFYFGSRGIDGMIESIRYAREHRIPFLGLCLGMQLAIVEFARHVVGLPEAHSIELMPDTPDPVIHLMADQKGVLDIGGTLRLGSYPCRLDPDSRAFELYGEPLIHERHRHRYEVNNDYRTALSDGGMRLCGMSPDGRIVEMLELPDHPYFLATQAHPEFNSRPNHPHPLFLGLISSAVLYRSEEL